MSVRVAMTRAGTNDGASSHLQPPHPSSGAAEADVVLDSGEPWGARGTRTAQSERERLRLGPSALVLVQACQSAPSWRTDGSRWACRLGVRGDDYWERHGWKHGRVPGRYQPWVGLGAAVLVVAGLGLRPTCHPRKPHPQCLGVITGRKGPLCRCRVLFLQLCFCCSVPLAWCQVVPPCGFVCSYRLLAGCDAPSATGQGPGHFETTRPCRCCYLGLSVSAWSLARITRE